MSRGGYNIVDLLVHRGLSKPDAIYVDNEISEDRLPYLINSLVSESNESEELLRGILYEYGIDLEDTFDNVEILDDKNPLRIVHGLNVSTQKLDGVEELLFARDIPYIVKGDTIFMCVPDDSTLYMIDNSINNLKENKMSDNLNESTGLILGFSNEVERKRLLRDAGIKEDFGDISPMDDANAIPSPDLDPPVDSDVNPEEYPQVDVVTDPVTDVEPAQNSEAMNTVQDCLTTIQQCIPDLKVSEFKTFILQLNDFALEAKQRGNSMISERRKK